VTADGYRGVPAREKKVGDLVEAISGTG